MAANIFDLAEVTPEAAAFVDRSFQIADQIRHVLRQKGWTQRDLAAALGKKEPEISRMLVGTHNFTLKTLTRLEVVLGTALITTPQQVAAEQVPSFTVQGAVRLPDQATHFDTSRLLTLYSELVLSKQPVTTFISNDTVAPSLARQTSPSAKSVAPKQAAGSPVACLVEEPTAYATQLLADAGISLAVAA